eukprot:757665-Hanusia_phi.AAC.1
MAEFGSRRMLQGFHRSQSHDEESPNTACLIFMLMIVSSVAASLVAMVLMLERQGFGMTHVSAEEEEEEEEDKEEEGEDKVELEVEVVELVCRSRVQLGAGKLDEEDRTDDEEKHCKHRDQRHKAQDDHGSELSRLDIVLPDTSSEFPKKWQTEKALVALLVILLSVFYSYRRGQVRQGSDPTALVADADEFAVRASQQPSSSSAVCEFQLANRRIVAESVQSRQPQGLNPPHPPAISPAMAAVGMGFCRGQPENVQGAEPWRVGARELLESAAANECLPQTAAQGRG